jgi:hypothetical protein
VCEFDCWVFPDNVSGSEFYMNKHLFFMQVISSVNFQIPAIQPNPWPTSGISWNSPAPTAPAAYLYPPTAGHLGVPVPQPSAMPMMIESRAASILKFSPQDVSSAFSSA